MGVELQLKTNINSSDKLVDITWELRPRRGGSGALRFNAGWQQQVLSSLRDVVGAPRKLLDHVASPRVHREGPPVAPTTDEHCVPVPVAPRHLKLCDADHGVPGHEMLLEPRAPLDVVRPIELALRRGRG